MSKDSKLDAAVAALLTPWSGPYGGTPPFDEASSATIGRAYEAAIASKRAEVRAIATDPAPPTFANTIEALEDGGRELRRVDCLFRVFAQTMGTGAMPEVERRIAPLAPSLEDEIAHDDALFARINAVYEARNDSGLTEEQQRLVSVVRDRLLRRGAGLEPAAKKRLAEISGRLAELQATFNQNLVTEQDTQVVYLEDEADLGGLSDELRAAMAAAARSRGRQGQWAVPNTRPSAWPFLTYSTRRDLREKVWRMWATRGANPGENDNRPVINEILRLRGEKARLLGFPSFAHFATADRMAGTPENAMGLLERVWSRVIGPTRERIAYEQALADAEGAGITIEPWDRLHYSEKLRQTRFKLDAEAVKPYLEFESILQAMLWAAGKAYGLEFTEAPDLPVCHPDVRVFLVSREGEPFGVLFFDLLYRPGKMRGSWQVEYRTAETFRGRVLPIASVNSNVEMPDDGGPALLSWEVANVLFHEVGHALHMLCGRTSYPSLGSASVAWDIVELPALFNERWLYDRELLSRFARHNRTGEPIPPEMISKIERAARFDRVFSVNLEYLGPAIVDMRMYLEAHRPDVDAVQIEKDVYAELEMPSAVDLILRVPYCWHSFSDSYPANLYVYLWADVMAADVADAFEGSPGGLSDPETAERYFEAILSVGNTVPADEAVRSFHGRDTDHDALLRRFGLETVPRCRTSDPRSDTVPIRKATG